MVDARFDSLLDAPSPAVLTTYKRDGSALTSPVWFRYHEDALEVVVAAGDVKLQHLARDPSASLTVFEATAPFRGVQTRREPQLIERDVTDVRLAIASRYLGSVDGARFTAQRASQGTLLRFAVADARTWDLSAILPKP